MTPYRPTALKRHRGPGRERDLAGTDASEKVVCDRPMYGSAPAPSNQVTTL